MDGKKNKFPRLKRIVSDEYRELEPSGEKLIVMLFLVRTSPEYYRGLSLAHLEWAAGQAMNHGRDQVCGECRYFKNKSWQTRVCPIPWKDREKGPNPEDKACDNFKFTEKRCGTCVQTHLMFEPRKCKWCSEVKSNVWEKDMDYDRYDYCPNWSFDGIPPVPRREMGIRR